MKNGFKYKLAVAYVEPKKSVTVVLPCRNAESTIAGAIQSVLNQTFADFELWVLENGSTDRTLEIAEKFRVDQRVRVFSLGAVGFQGALEFALANVSSNWIARMDADDLCLPERLDKQMQFLSANPEYVFVGTAFVVMTPFQHIFSLRKQLVSRPIDRNSFVRTGDGAWFFADASVVFNRKAALAAGGYDPEFKMGDQPLWFRLLEHGKGFEMAEPLYVYRSNPISMNFGTYHNDVAAVRRKYLKSDFKSEPFDWAKRNNKFWYKVATQELIAGNGTNARAAVEKLVRTSSRGRVAKLRLLSYFSGLAAIYYRISKRSGFVHLPSLETELLGYKDD